jgi:ATP phosphoribosyltransferase regulatory subunit
MNRWKQHIPQGVQDYLPGECYNKRRIEQIIRKTFYTGGYDEIESPVFEYYDVFTGDKEYIEQENMFKIVEAGGRIQVLRPDITMPIARIVGTKLKSLEAPIRLSYLSNVYRYEELQTGKQREIAQAGIELLGVGSPEGDGEVIATAIQCFINLGLEDFLIEIGQVEFFKGLVEDAGLNPEEAEQLRLLIEEKNQLMLEMFLKEFPMDKKLKGILMDLPSMYGDVDVLERGAEYTKNPRCQRAIANIRQVHEVLKDYGLEEFITFDLGMLHSLNYYTGIIFKGFTRDLGFTICGGGRYDNLLSEFGRNLPATGFAMGLKRLLMALDRQGKLLDLPSVDTLVVFDTENRRRGYQLAQKIREEGRRVELLSRDGESINPQEYARIRNISNIIDLSEKDRGDYKW